MTGGAKMTIISVVTPNKQGRVSLSGTDIESFSGCKVVVEEGSERISVINSQDFSYGTEQKIDQKNRVALPKWILEEIKGSKLIVMVDEEGKIFLSPKTGSIL